jgi:hypothetical protein
MKHPGRHSFYGKTWRRSPLIKTHHRYERYQAFSLLEKWHPSFGLLVKIFRTNQQSPEGRQSVSFAGQTRKIAKGQQDL